MSESCSKCGASLGTYEYNRIGEELWCDTCTSGEVKQEVPKPKIKGEVSTIQYREEIYEIKSIEPKQVFWIALLLFLAFCGILVITGPILATAVVVPPLLFPLLLAVYKYNNLTSFHLKGNTLEETKVHFDKKKIIDLKEVTQFKESDSLIPTRGGPPITYVKLYHNQKLLTKFDSYSIKNYTQLKEALFNNILAANTGKKLEVQKGLRSKTYTIHEKTTTIKDPDLLFIKNVSKRPDPQLKVIDKSDTDPEIYPNELYGKPQEEPYTPTTGLFCKEDEISYWDIYNE